MIPRRCSSVHTKVYSILCNDLYGNRIFKKVNMCICISDSVCHTVETNTTLSIKPTPIKNNLQDIKKRRHYAETWDDLPFLVNFTTFLLIPTVAKTDPIWQGRDRKTPLPDLEEELMMQALMSTREWGRSGLLPHPLPFPLILKP